MLSEVLKLMEQEQSVAVAEIAQKLGWSLQRVETMLAQLASMGYIQKKAVSRSSCSAGRGCPGCSDAEESACQGCQVLPDSLYSWVITDRGKSVLH
ncbi:FeoC-like transcriptional regulator [Desulfitobacterium sp.]|uniref:FeoC-like transcriptional regulator n=1 Tax=Desulfitobacterium sp. TaxID=49981 RepID=UPI002C16B50D|nr:FeoC-like transcriptional regulator [Desulfitobacterium sp.]HVJ50409.1 FeoC-like transcriptional regulator [Desulfitobacterium sp.]